jgi:hypothetical protein
LFETSGDAGVRFYFLLQFEFYFCHQNDERYKKKSRTSDFRLNPQTDGSVRTKIGSDKPDEKVYPSRRKIKHKKQTETED